MKKYYPVDFDEKGNAVLGNAKSNPTSNGFIPTAWATGGSDEGKQGIKSITISPAITTTPALESFCPIYWEDLTEDEKKIGMEIVVDTAVELVDTDAYTITLTPTAEWYAAAPDSETTGDKGAQVTFTTNPKKGTLYTFFGASNEDDPKTASEVLRVTLLIRVNK